MDARRLVSTNIALRLHIFITHFLALDKITRKDFIICGVSSIHRYSWNIPLGGSTGTSSRALTSMLEVSRIRRSPIPKEIFVMTNRSWGSQILS
jgi:hypothetical protein